MPTSPLRLAARIAALTCIVVACAAAPAVAAPAYYPSGPQVNVPKATVTSGGWRECFRGSYGNFSPAVSTVLAGCTGTHLLLAAQQVGSPNLAVLAAAPREDVTYDTGYSNTPHVANGSAWYFSANWSWGFAVAGDAITRNSCDVEMAHPDQRLCWHTGGGSMNGGWRAGSALWLNSDATYDKVVFVNGVLAPSGGVPTISGQPYQGKTLTANASPGTWSGSPTSFAYVWKRCTSLTSCTAIPGATGATYVLTAADLGASLRVTVTASNDGGSGSATSDPTQPVGSYSRVVLADAPLAFWRLGDSTDTSRVADTTGRFPGEYKNGASGTGGRVVPTTGVSGDGDTVAVFTGNGTYGYVNGLAAPRHGFTIEAWVKPTSDDAGTVFQQGGAGALYLQAGRRPAFRPVDNFGEELVAPSVIGSGTFHHLVGTWAEDVTGGTGTMSLYVDGRLVASAHSNHAPSGTSTVYLGYGTLAPWLKGYLDEVAYYDHPLTADQVLTHYTADPQPPLRVPGHRHRRHS